MTQGSLRPHSKAKTLMSRNGAWVGIRLWQDFSVDVAYSGTTFQERRITSNGKQAKAAGADQPSQVFAMKPHWLRVLIVEDDPIIAMELEMLLEDLEAEVVGIAVSAAEAVRHIREHNPDLVTMDINISGDCDGVTVAQQIFDTYGIRSIFVSALHDAVTRGRAGPCNPIGWIVKPVSRSDLAELLTRVKRQND